MLPWKKPALGPVGAGGCDNSSRAWASGAYGSAAFTCPLPINKAALNTGSQDLNQNSEFDFGHAGLLALLHQEEDASDLTAETS